VLRFASRGATDPSPSHTAFANGKKNGLDESAHFLVVSEGGILLCKTRTGKAECCAGASHARIPRFRAQHHRLSRTAMGFLAGKRLLITGVLNNRSIAYGIARACRREGAELAFSYQGERFKDRIAEFAAEFDSKLTFECDVGDDGQIQRLFDQLGGAWDGFDGFVHAIAFAPREAIAGDFLDGMTRENFRIAHDISAYSFPAMAKAALPRLRPGASLLTLTYLGASRYVPNYNTMGLAKASLEASVRFLAQSLGARGVRVNAVSAGPIKTLAASGIKDFGKLQAEFAAVTPIRRNVTLDDVGNTAAFLLSDLAAGISAEVIFVDGGYSHMAAGQPGAAGPAAG
jgi:enoyl-[acyl-carrier protein] reductase I